MIVKLLGIAVICNFVGLVCACSLKSAASAEPTIEPAASSDIQGRVITVNDNNQISVKLNISEEVSSVTANTRVYILVVENNGSENLDIGGLNLFLSPLVLENRIDARNQVNSPIDIVSMANLEMNQSSELLKLPAGSKITRELRIEKFQWLRSIQSTWEYRELSDSVKSSGRYQFIAEIEIFPQVKTETYEMTLGDQDIKIVPSFRIASNRLEIDAP
jgi:hypothetical protein